MINAELHKQPVALDTVAHRQLRINTQTSATDRFASFASALISFAEFSIAAREFPILFVLADKDDKTGKQQVAPVALFGLEKGENLFVEGDKWDAEYLPALFRTYPFTLARVDEAGERWAVVYDGSWKGLSNGGPGDALFTEQGEATPFLQKMHEFLVDVENQIERTRLGGQLLLERQLLKPMRFDATLGDGRQVSLDGFLTLDDERMNALTDAEIVELHRNGLLGILHLHRMSLGNMQRLLARRLAKEKAKAAPAKA